MICGENGSLISTFKSKFAWIDEDFPTVRIHTTIVLNSLKERGKINSTSPLNMKPRINKTSTLLNICHPVVQKWYATF